MKEKYYDAIINGVKAKNFPKIPVDYGYRDSTNFWYEKFSKPIAMPIPAKKEADLNGVIYAANRIDPEIKFTEEACKSLVKVPRIFLKTVLNGCVEYAKEHNIKVIDENVMKDINDKRRKEKGK